MKRVTKIIVGVLIVTPLIAGGVMAGKGYRMYQHGHGWMHGDEASRAEAVEYVRYRITKRLELNTTQQEKLKAVANQLGKIRDSIPKDQYRNASDIIGGSTFDREKAQALVNQHTSNVQNNAPELIAVLGDFYDSLNADQQLEVRDILAERRHFMMKGSHGMHGRHGWGNHGEK
jgi:Spy/CpxP family protein refolding chaperone